MVVQPQGAGGAGGVWTGAGGDGGRGCWLYNPGVAHGLWFIYHLHHVVCACLFVKVPSAPSVPTFCHCFPLEH